MKKNISILISFLLLIIIPCYTQIQTYQLLNEVKLKQTLLNNTNQNCLKMFDIAIDQRRGLAYTQSIVTRYTSIVNINSKREIGSVLSNQSTGQLVSLKINPYNGYLLQGFVELTPVIVNLVNPSNSRIMGSYTLGSGAPLSGLDVDPIQNYLFLIENSDIKIFNGTDFSPINSINTPNPQGDLAIDTANKKVYCVSRNLINGNGIVRVYSISPPFSLIRTISIPSTVPLGRIVLDIPENRFFLISTNQIKVIDLNSSIALKTINLNQTISDICYASATKTLYGVVTDAYIANGLHGSWCKFYIINVSTGKVDSVMMGDKTSKLEYYESAKKLVFPDMHSGYIEIYDVNTKSIDSVDIGESVDYLNLSPDKNILYAVKRLGGSRIVRYNKNDKSINEFKAGAWPSTCEVDSALNKLFVMNHFESSVSIFNASTGSLISTVKLQTDEGRLDAILSSYLDETLHKLFIVFPEFGKFFVLDCYTYNVQTIPIPDYKFDSENDKGIGTIQLISDTKYQRLFIFMSKLKKLKILNLNTYAVIDSVNLTTQWNSLLDKFKENCLFIDPSTDKLFIGNVIYNLQKGLVEGKLLGSACVIGYNKSRTILYGISISKDSVNIFEHNPINYNVISFKYLTVLTDSYLPVYRYDKLNNDFYIGEFNQGFFKHFDFDKSVLVKIDDNNFNNDKIKFELYQNYPNPFNSSTVIKFSLPEFPKLAKVVLDVYDLLGREVKSLVNKDLNSGEHFIQFNAIGLPTGLYFYKLQYGNDMVSMRKLLLVK